MKNHSTYRAPLRDLQFVLHELIGVTGAASLEHADGSSIDTINQILDAADRFASDVISPLNPVGDREGCSLPEPGVVHTPRGFKQAYDLYVEGGWPSLGCDAAHGGQGLPLSVTAAVAEIFVGANLAWTSYPGMSSAAYECLKANGSQQQKALYLPKLASGQWAGTMCLTEPHSGTDLGLLRTRAQHHGDGSYSVTGTKIFISGGEQDLTENIVHLVLARLNDAPSGVRGLSLFVVPKFVPDATGGIGTRNAVTCGSVEHKMGIRGNSTCTMNFDHATAWLVGSVNNGLAAMFVMMNHARLGVGINAVGQMEGAYQKALAYARERRQGRFAGGALDPGVEADTILAHADVRRMLLTQKACAEGHRALTLWVAHLTDMQHGASDSAERVRSDSLVALLTPVIKAFASDTAVECTSLAIQVFGGHGFISDTGVEQHLRDCRIIPLYEGANGIQALDLLRRKVLTDNGRKLDVFVAEIEQFAQQLHATPAVVEFRAPLLDGLTLLRQSTRTAQDASLKAADAIGAIAVPYLKLLGHVSLAWMWARMASIAVAQAHSSDPIYVAKLATARFYFAKLLPEVYSLARVIANGATAITDYPEEAF